MSDTIINGGGDTARNPLTPEQLDALRAAFNDWFGWLGGEPGGIAPAPPPPPPKPGDSAPDFTIGRSEAELMGRSGEGSSIFPPDPPSGSGGGGSSGSGSGSGGSGSGSSSGNSGSGSTVLETPGDTLIIPSGPPATPPGGSSPDILVTPGGEFPPPPPNGGNGNGNPFTDPESIFFDPTVEPPESILSPENPNTPRSGPRQGGGDPFTDPESILSPENPNTPRGGEPGGEPGGPARGSEPGGPPRGGAPGAAAEPAPGGGVTGRVANAIDTAGKGLIIAVLFDGIAQDTILFVTGEEHPGFIGPAIEGTWVGDGLETLAEYSPITTGLIQDAGDLGHQVGLGGTAEAVAVVALFPVQVGEAIFELGVDAGDVVSRATGFGDWLADRWMANFW
jgi:hypothetical protein